MKAKAMTTVKYYDKIILLIMYLLTFSLLSCVKEEYNTDVDQPHLLPDKEDYINSDFGTQALAQEIVSAYPENKEVDIKLVIYDTQTRTMPLLVFAESQWPLAIQALKNGNIQVGYIDYQAAMMPLKMTTAVEARLSLNATSDTIWLKGDNGIVRTKSTADQPIGTPLPESDDAELTGYYVRPNGDLYLFVDLMLPIPIKAHISHFNLIHIKPQ